MKGVIILGSARGDGNTAKIVDTLSKHTGFKIINLLDYNINYFDYNHTHQNDDFLPLMERIIEEYDLLVFATPVYWYSMSAQLKTFFDRISDLITIKKELGRKLKGKSMAMISCGHSNKAIENFNLPFKNSSEYLGMRYLGDLYTWHINSDQLLAEVEEKIVDFSKKLTSE